MGEATEGKVFHSVRVGCQGLGALRVELRSCGGPPGVKGYKRSGEGAGGGARNTTSLTSRRQLQWYRC